MLVGGIGATLKKAGIDVVNEAGDSAPRRRRLAVKPAATSISARDF